MPYIVIIKCCEDNAMHLSSIYINIKSLTAKKNEWVPAVSSAFGYVLAVTGDGVAQIAQAELFEPEEVTEVAVQQAFVGAVEVK